MWKKSNYVFLSLMFSLIHRKGWLRWQHYYNNKRKKIRHHYTTSFKYLKVMKLIHILFWGRLFQLRSRWRELPSNLYQSVLVLIVHSMPVCLSVDSLVHLFPAKHTNGFNLLDSSSHSVCLHTLMFALCRKNKIGLSIVFENHWRQTLHVCCRLQ